METIDGGCTSSDGKLIIYNNTVKSVFQPVALEIVCSKDFETQSLKFEANLYFRYFDD